MEMTPALGRRFNYSIIVTRNIVEIQEHFARCLAHRRALMHVSDHEKKEEGEEEEKEREEGEKENIGIGNFLKHYHSFVSPRCSGAGEIKGSLFLKGGWYFILEEQKLFKLRELVSVSIRAGVPKN